MRARTSFTGITGPCAQEGSTLGLMFCSCLLKFLIILEEGGPRFHFALGSANHAAGPEGFENPNGL